MRSHDDDDIYIYTHTYININKYTHIHIYIYIHTYIHNFNRFRKTPLLPEVSKAHCSPQVTTHPSARVAAGAAPKNILHHRPGELRRKTSNSSQGLFLASA